MDLHDRVMEILDGRIKLGAGKKPRKKKAPKKKPSHVLNRVPPMYKVAHTNTDNRRYTRLADQYVGQNPKITDEMLMHHYPTSAEIMGTDPQDPGMMAALQDLVSHKEPSVRKAAGVVARGLNMPLVGYGVQIAGTDGVYAQNVRAGRQVSKNYGGQLPRCRKGCKHMRCRRAIMMRGGMVDAGQRGSVTGGKKKYPYEGRQRDHRWIDHVKKYQKEHPGMSYKEAMEKAGPSYKLKGKGKCPKGCHCTKCKSASKKVYKGYGKKEESEKKSSFPYEGRMRDHRWTDFVKEFAKLNNMSYKEAMSAAAPYYQDRSPLDKRDAPKGAVAKPKHTGRIKMGGKKKKKKAPSEWVQYVKEFAKLNNISYKQALKEAGPSYHAQA